MRDNQRCCCAAPGRAGAQGGSPTSAIELQAALLSAIGGLAELMAQLTAQLTTASGAVPTPEAWCQPQPLQPASGPGHPPGVGVSPSAGHRLDPAWDELSVVELRALLRSYPIDRASLPAPIELLRRGELLEALSQLQALNP